MKRTFSAVLFALAAALWSAPAAHTADKAPWLHVEVTEEDDDGAKVSVNVPVSLIDIALKAVKDEDLQGGRVRIHRHRGDVELEDLRRMWAELKKAGDAEFITVEKEDESVRVERKGQRVLMHVAERYKGELKEKVRVDVPIAVVDALLGGDGESLDLTAAVRELSKVNSGEFIRVDDGKSHVRVWID